MGSADNAGGIGSVAQGAGALAGSAVGAALIPFGGVVVTPPVPCTAPPGAFMFVLGPPSPGSYIYFPPPLTTTYLYGPPLRPGQWVLGNGIPSACVIGTAPPIPVIQVVTQGSSNPVGL